MLSSIKKMLDSFEKYGIEYCHWKSNEHLEEALIGDTDLDILFRSEQRVLLEHALSEAGLKRFRATSLMQYNAIEDYIGFDMEAAKIWHLHLHYCLSIGEKHLKGYTVPWTEFVLSRRHIESSKAGDIYISDAGDEYFLLLIRMALKLRWRDFGKKIGGDDILEMEWLKNRSSAQAIISTAGELLDKQVADEIQKLLKSDIKNKNQLLHLQKILRRKMKYFSSYKRSTSWMVRTIREVFWLFGGVKRRVGYSSTKASRRISPSGGKVVAFLGCDGAGKSTTLSYVKKEFNKKIDVYSTYLGSGDGSSSLLRRPMKMVAKKLAVRALDTRWRKKLLLERNKVLNLNYIL